MTPCPAAIRAVRAVLDDNSSTKAAGYVNACGTSDARRAIAAFHSVHLAPRQHVDHDPTLSSPHGKGLTEDDVIVANGCSGALELALTSLLNPDDVLLVPLPGFPLYQVIAESHGASVLPYRLVESSGWECDLVQIESLVRMPTQRQRTGQQSARIKAIVVNNPSNPTGAVFSKDHLRRLVALCERLEIVIIADEVYGDLTFKPHKFYPMASIAAELGHQVPIITASGIGKQFLLPGWRVGWLVFQDDVYGSLSQVQAGAKRLAQVILGASHLAQTAIPSLLEPKNIEIRQWKHDLRTALQTQADILCDRLSAAPGLRVIRPGGAMYAMVRIDADVWCSSLSSADPAITSDTEWCQALLREENVFVLPGTAFGLPGTARMVFAAPPSTLMEAASRIVQFCHRHAMDAPLSNPRHRNEKIQTNGVDS